MNLAQAVGKRLKDILKERKITQYQLSKDGGIARSTLSVIVSAKYRTVNLDTIYQITQTLNMTLKDFFDNEIFEEITE